MKKVGIVACSDAQKEEYRERNEELVRFLESIDYEPILSSCIYAAEGVFSGTPKARAGQLMSMFADPDVEEIYDISGGDVANQILDDLDYELISRSRAAFWGYSDLTTVINAIYTMTGKASVLYQIKHMVYGKSAELQKERFLNRNELFSPAFRFVQKNAMKGIVVGGNIRCFLKLAGTGYFPDLENKILLLEALGGSEGQLRTYFSQLEQLGTFNQVAGILLGTFTKFEESRTGVTVTEILKPHLPDGLPVARTPDIGHGADAKAIEIGAFMEFMR